MGRDIEAIKITGEDRRKYREKVRRSLDVFARMLREHRFEASPSQVGVEIELNLVDCRGSRPCATRTCSTPSPTRPGRPSWASSTWRSTCRPGELGGNALADLEKEIRASLNGADAKAREHRQPPGHGRDPAHAGAKSTCTRAPSRPTPVTGC